MPDHGLSPLIVPYGADQTIYLVVDSFASRDGACREIELERSDLDMVVSDLLSGEFNAPVRVIAFNTLEHWTEDISQQVAWEIQSCCDAEAAPVPDYLSDFVANHTRQIRQAALSG